VRASQLRLIGAGQHAARCVTKSLKRPLQAFFSPLLHAIAALRQIFFGPASGLSQSVKRGERPTLIQDIRKMRPARVRIFAL
ncbi:MAG: hypothetical protein RSB42_14820, partial [Comamonas sp.]